MEYIKPNQTGRPLETHLINQLDRVLDRQRETHQIIGEVRRTVERMDIRASMQATPPAQQKKAKEPWNIQLMVYVGIIALGLGGHISLDLVKAILTTLPR